MYIEAKTVNLIEQLSTSELWFEPEVDLSKFARWWFQNKNIITPTWWKDLIWLIFF